MDLAASRRFEGEAPAKWLRLEYSQCFASQPCRYLLRFVCSDGSAAEHVLPAAVLGRARWIGIVPRTCTGFEIWKAAPGAATVSIDRAECLTSLRVAARIAVRNPVRLPAFLHSLVRSDPRTQMLRALTALDFFPLERFTRFVATHTRPVGDIDRASLAMAGEPNGVRLDFALFLNRGSKADLQRTLHALDGQIDRNFGLLIVTGAACADTTSIDEELRALGLPFTIVGADDASAANVTQTAGSDRWIGEIEPGDVLAPEAVLALRSFIAAHRAVDAVYTDNALLGAGRGPAYPVLKPDWSPALYESVDYIDRLCLIRFAADPSAHEPHGALRSGFARRMLTARTGERQVAHLKRILVDTVRPAETASARDARPPFASPYETTTSIIIPTRDRPELLQAAIGSLATDMARSRNEIIVVDNGSTDPRCLAYLQDIRAVERIAVLDHPGAFNFSRLINAGAARARGDTLILLNNDCAVLHDGWIEAMASLTQAADVGAVGAKLLYDDGRLQHAGVGVGLGGEAGHRNRGMAADAPGYRDRLRFVHEVSAVTAACLAVRRDAFHAVAGFDEAFAVAFNDIDFCLRLRARGHRNLFTPHATLRHSESVSRGSDRHASQRDRWSREAALFRQRWQSVILDDPYMHPLLSLWRFREVLQ